MFANLIALEILTGACRPLALRLLTAFAVLFAASTPAQAATPMIAAGGTHTCALLADGTVQCWGDDGSGQLGAGRLATGAGHDHCDVWPGSDIPIASPCSRTPVPIPGIADAVAIAAGVGHTCALLANRHVRCWGSNSLGALGNGSRATAPTLVRELAPPDVVGIDTAVAVAGGGNHACAVLQDGSVWCWGGNQRGQLGYAPEPGAAAYGEAYSAVPVKVPGVSGAVGVSTGYGHSCAVTHRGAVRCWGDNRVGQLGLGVQSPDPVAADADIAGIANAVEISSGIDFTCARLSTVAVVCWGGSFYTGVQPGHLLPQAVRGAGLPMEPVVALASGIGSSACAVVQGGAVRCWSGQLSGSSQETPAYEAQAPIAGIAGAQGVAAGTFHTCALLASSGVMCWEQTRYPSPLGRGGAGLPDPKGSPLPVDVALRGPAVGLAVGWGIGCALLQGDASQGGAVQCWGDGPASGNGQATGVHTGTPSTFPAPVAGIGNAVAVAVSDQSACALLADGQLRCWGQNEHAQLGDGTHTAAWVPVAPNLPFSQGGAPGSSGKAIGVAMSAWRTCAVLADRSATCWGARTPAQLLLYNPTVYGHLPQAITGLRDVVQVVMGTSRDCALLTSGRVQCWGYVASSTGDTEGADNTVPVTVSGVSHAVRLATNKSSFCAVELDGSISCWGDDNRAQPLNLSVPVARLSLSCASMVALA